MKSEIEGEGDCWSKRIYSKMQNDTIITSVAAAAKTYDKSEITSTMKQTIKRGNEKIGKKKQTMALSSSTITKTCSGGTCSSCGGEGGSAGDGDGGYNNAGQEANNNKDVKVDEEPNRCQGEKKKGGRCSRKAKKGKYCETHATERREMERRMEGGVYVYRSKEMLLYDVEELMRMSVV